MKLIKFIKVFFHYFGSQNDYLYPTGPDDKFELYPFKKAHLWKTRFGFKTSFELTKMIIYINS